MLNRTRLAVYRIRDVQTITRKFKTNHVISSDTYVNELIIVMVI